MTAGPLTPAEHRAAALRALDELKGYPPTFNGLAQAAIAHALLAACYYLEPPPEPDLPGLPLGWRVTTRQSEKGERKWGYVLTRPGHEPDISDYRWRSSPGAVMAGLEYAAALQGPQDTEDDTTGEQS